MARQPSFDGFERPRRAPPRVMAKLIDAGAGESAQVCSYRCRKCGWESGWVEDERSDTKIKRGIPCEVCNATKEGE